MAGFGLVKVYTVRTMEVGMGEEKQKRISITKKTLKLNGVNRIDDAVGLQARVMHLRKLMYERVDFGPVDYETLEGSGVIPFYAINCLLFHLARKAGVTTSKCEQILHGNVTDPDLFKIHKGILALLCVDNTVRNEDNSSANGIMRRLVAYLEGLPDGVKIEWPAFAYKYAMLADLGHVYSQTLKKAFSDADYLMSMGFFNGKHPVAESFEFNSANSDWRRRESTLFAAELLRFAEANGKDIDWAHGQFAVNKYMRSNDDPIDTSYNKEGLKAEIKWDGEKVHWIGGNTKAVVKETKGEGNTKGIGGKMVQSSLFEENEAEPIVRRSKETPVLDKMRAVIKGASAVIVEEVPDEVPVIEEPQEANNKEEGSVEVADEAIVSTIAGSGVAVDNNGNTKKRRHVLTKDVGKFFKIMLPKYGTIKKSNGQTNTWYGVVLSADDIGKEFSRHGKSFRDEFGGVKVMPGQLWTIVGGDKDNSVQGWRGFGLMGSFSSVGCCLTLPDKSVFHPLLQRENKPRMSSQEQAMFINNLVSNDLVRLSRWFINKADKSTLMPPVKGVFLSGSHISVEPYDRLLSMAENTIYSDSCFKREWVNRSNVKAKKMFEKAVDPVSMEEVEPVVEKVEPVVIVKEIEEVKMPTEKLKVIETVKEDATPMGPDSVVQQMMIIGFEAVYGQFKAGQRPAVDIARAAQAMADLLK